MRLLSIALILLAGCADDECADNEFRPVDIARSCLGPAVQAGCAAESQQTMTTCSIGPDGQAWLSFHGSIYPGGRACTDADKIEVAKLGTCDSTDAGPSDVASDACEARMWTAPGCSVSPTCMTLPLDACAAVIEYCACDGRTITGACGMAPAPWKFVGRCDALDTGAD